MLAAFTHVQYIASGLMSAEYATDYNYRTLMFTQFTQ